MTHQCFGSTCLTCDRCPSCGWRTVAHDGAENCPRDRRYLRPPFLLPGTPPKDRFASGGAA